MSAFANAVTRAIAVSLAALSIRTLRARRSGGALLGACTCALGGRLLRDVGLPERRDSLHDTLSAIRIEHTI